MTFSFSSVVDTLQDTFGEDVTYRSGHLPAVTVKAVYRQPVQEGFAIASSGVISNVTVFEVAVDVIANPKIGDEISRADGARYCVQSEPTRDEAGTVWLLDAVPRGA